MTGLLHDPLFFATAIPAVILIGFSKGGFGGALGVVGVPLMALVIPPVQAAAILLPTLMLMDAAALWVWRHGPRDPRTLWNLLPGAAVGVGLGWLTAAIVTEAMVKLLVGVVALGFVVRWAWQRLGGREKIHAHNAATGLFWGALSGFTSFVAHAGGAAYQVYALPLRQDPRTYTATSVVFFAVVNALKVLPYFALGELDIGNLLAASVLTPVAVASTVAGAAVVKRMRAEIFYPVTYALVFLLSLKLLYDGVAGL
ncbi:MAG: sulfite exporter TauE/SafE family protein [Rhizobiaceae bacterium]|nr:MAG: sulfite exporter TauE/SafE family protein [Rhizobiaceae bacterium]